MACSGAAIIVLHLLYSSLATMPTTAHHTNNQATNCRHYHPDMLGTAADHDEHRVCGQTTANGPWMTPPTHSTPGTTSMMATTAATTEPPVDLSSLISTISRQATALYRAADYLLSSIVEDFDLKFPGNQAPCFYAEREKGNHLGNDPGARLRSDHITMEKYCDYFSLLEHLRLSQYYEALLMGLTDLRGNVGILANALNTSAVPAPVAQQDGAKAFGDSCFNTGSNQQAVTLLNLQVFLKEHLLLDIRTLMDRTKAG